MSKLIRSKFVMSILLIIQFGQYFKERVMDYFNVHTIYHVVTISSVHFG